MIVDLLLLPDEISPAPQVAYSYSASLYSKNKSYTIYIPYKKQINVIKFDNIAIQSMEHDGAKPRVYRSLPLPDP